MFICLFYIHLERQVHSIKYHVKNVISHSCWLLFPKKVIRNVAPELGVWPCVCLWFLKYILFLDFYLVDSCVTLYFIIQINHVYVLPLKTKIRTKACSNLDLVWEQHPDKVQSELQEHNFSNLIPFCFHYISHFR